MQKLSLTIRDKSFCKELFHLYILKLLLNISTVTFPGLLLGPTHTMIAIEYNSEENIALFPGLLHFMTCIYQLQLPIALHI